MQSVWYGKEESRLQPTVKRDQKSSQWKNKKENLVLVLEFVRVWSSDKEATQL